MIGADFFAGGVVVAEQATQCTQSRSATLLESRCSVNQTFNMCLIELKRNEIETARAADETRLSGRSRDDTYPEQVLLAMSNSQVPKAVITKLVSGGGKPLCA